MNKIEEISQNICKSVFCSKCPKSIYVTCDRNWNDLHCRIDAYKDIIVDLYNEICFNLTYNNDFWFSVKDKFPPEGVEVLVRVKNKNKPDGIYLYDICTYYEDTGWENRVYTLEDIIDWKYLSKEDWINYE